MACIEEEFKVSCEEESIMSKCPGGTAGSFKIKLREAIMCDSENEPFAYDCPMESWSDEQKRAFRMLCCKTLFNK